MPSDGSQKLRAIARGVRANDPGGQARPRSRTTTLRPCSAIRKAATDPPKPEPTTTASTDSTYCCPDSLIFPADPPSSLGQELAGRVPRRGDGRQEARTGYSGV